MDDQGTAVSHEPLTRLISVRLINTVPWHGGWLRDALARLDAGESAPPIIVGRRCFLDGSYVYMVDDGMHRTKAAKIRGLTRIRARVTYTVQSRPPRSLVWKHEQLWEGLEDAPTLRAVGLYANSQDCHAILEALQLLGLMRPAAPLFPSLLAQHHPDYQHVS
jgi:hypothetical protein